MEEAHLRSMACFGVAGNFTGHLEQAGEASDFTKVKAAAGAPKALFPTYIPGGEHEGVPQFLSVFPFDEYRLIFPKLEEESFNLQIEPECAVVVDIDWENGLAVDLKPYAFAASNDCSIRRKGARKISQKKNWGPASKGMGANLIAIDKFQKGGILDRYRIASFLIRDGKAYDYGEDSAVRDYSYFYDKLIDWCLDRINNQVDEGPAEPIGSYLKAAGYPKKVMISVGATRYTDYGQHNFLKNGDRSVVVVYPEDVYSHEEIVRRAATDNLEEDDISVIAQEVIL
ncbi:MAG: DUF5718 family protein [Aeromonadales bacterium]|nr:DUF5718 family protein [Aeromonadales bacterium]MDY2891689.1 DUF5718 family protein [Succinivibrio sp.]